MRLCIHALLLPPPSPPPHLLAELQKKRKQKKHDMLRRTARGQPVMKYRLDKILSQLGSGS